MESRKGRDAVVQHALLPSDSPLEKTPHNARVVSVALMAAVVTLLEMAAENSSPADLDRGHGAALRRGERSAMLVTMESPLPEGGSNTLIIRFLWVTNALNFFP